MATALRFDSQAIAEYCRRWRITELYVFGSVLRGDFRPDSDVDFMADYEPDSTWDLVDHVRMTRELASIVGRKVDLVDKPAIERSDNRFLRREILSTAEAVYAAR